MNTPERLRLIEMKARKKLTHPSRIKRVHPYITEIYEANDWVQSMKVCLENMVKTLDTLAESLNSLTEAIDRDRFIKNFKAQLATSTGIFADLSEEYANIVHLYLQMATVQTKQKIVQEMKEYWIRVGDSLVKAQAAIRNYQGRATMIGFNLRSPFRMLFE